MGVRDTPLLYVLWRRPAEKTESVRAGKTRVRRESARTAADRIQEAIEAESAPAEVVRETSNFGSNAKGIPAGATFLRWTETVGGQARTRGAIVFRGTDFDWFYTLWIDAPGKLTDEAWSEAISNADRSFGLDVNVLKKPNWYEEELRLNAPLPYNIFFSVGSSVAFALVMLLLGWWRLARIEF